MPELIRIYAKNKSYIVELCDLIKEIWIEFFNFEKPDKFDYILNFVNIDNIKSELKNNDFKYYFINFQNKNIGFILCENCDNFLNILRFYIKKEYRNQGIGSKIFEKILKTLKDENCKSILLFCDVENKNGIKFFSKLGFAKSRIMARYIGSGFYSKELKMKYNL